MSLYRAYKIDHAGHVIGPAAILAATNDEDAIAQAIRLCGEHKDCATVEVWDAGRLVHTHAIAPGV